jgi:hypothetical protein
VFFYIYRFFEKNPQIRLLFFSLNYTFALKYCPCGESGCTTAFKRVVKKDAKLFNLKKEADRELNWDGDKV